MGLAVADLLIGQPCISSPPIGWLRQSVARIWTIAGSQRIITLIFHVIVDFINSFILFYGGQYLMRVTEYMAAGILPLFICIEISSKLTGMVLKCMDMFSSSRQEFSHPIELKTFRLLFRKL